MYLQILTTDDNFNIYIYISQWLATNLQCLESVKK